MVTKEDYYAVLGIDRHADDKEIKRVYRRLARRYHPDLHPGDRNAEQRFKEINEAYEVLGDPEKRRQYDRQGHTAFFQENRSAGSDFGEGSGRFYGESFSDLFESILGRGERVQPHRGQDLTAFLEIGLEEAVYGHSTQVSFEKEVTCQSCRGSGIEGGGGARICPECHGDGRIRRREKVQVKIPAGVDTGSKVRIAGMGAPGHRGGPPGDLLIEVRVHPHPFFERRGNDLYCELPLTVSEAVLGGKVEVPTRDGMATMTIPPSTQSGQTFRLKGKGVPLLKGKGAGDQYVKVQVVTPKNVGEEGQRLIKRWQELFPENPRAGIAFRGFKR